MMERYWASTRVGDRRVPGQVMGGCHHECWEGPGAGGEAEPQQCRNARGVAARGSGRVWQTPDARLRRQLRLPRAAGRWLVQLMSLCAPHAPVPLGVCSRRTRRASRRSTRDLARYRVGLGWLGHGAMRCGAVRQHLFTLSPLPRSSSSPRLASQARNGRFGAISPTPRPGSSRKPSPSGSSEAGRGQQQGEGTWGGHGGRA